LDLNGGFMFLGKLSETEKQAFLCLANYVMKADGIIEEREMEVVNVLRGEMNTPNLLSNLTEAESFKILASSKKRVKKAIYIELLSIAMADGLVDANEEEHMKNILSQLSLSEIFSTNAQKWLIYYFKILQKGISLVNRRKPKKEA
jgi:tellurite resistance protein